MLYSNLPKRKLFFRRVQIILSSLTTRRDHHQLVLQELFVISQVVLRSVPTDDDLAAWMAGLDGLFERVAGRFHRVEPWRRTRAYVRGQLAPLASKNRWTLATLAKVGCAADRAAALGPPPARATSAT